MNNKNDTPEFIKGEETYRKISDFNTYSYRKADKCERDLISKLAQRLQRNFSNDQNFQAFNRLMKDKSSVSDKKKLSSFSNDVNSKNRKLPETDSSNKNDRSSSVYITCASSNILCNEINKNDSIRISGRDLALGSSKRLIEQHSLKDNIEFNNTYKFNSPSKIRHRYSNFIDSRDRINSIGSFKTSQSDDKLSNNDNIKKSCSHTEDKMLINLTWKSLNSAMINGDLKLVESILNENSDIIDFKGIIHGYSLLHWAVVYNNIDLVKLFVATGINPNIKSEMGNTPLQLAVYHNHTDIKKFLENQPCVNSYTENWNIFNHIDLKLSLKNNCYNDGLSSAEENLSIKSCDLKQKVRASSQRNTIKNMKWFIPRFSIRQKKVRS